MILEGLGELSHVFAKEDVVPRKDLVDEHVAFTRQSAYPGWDTYPKREGVHRRNASAQRQNDGARVTGLAELRRLNGDAWPLLPGFCTDPRLEVNDIHVPAPRRTIEHRSARAGKAAVCPKVAQRPKALTPNDLDRLLPTPNSFHARGITLQQIERRAYDLYLASGSEPRLQLFDASSVGFLEHQWHTHGDPRCYIIGYMIDYIMEYTHSYGSRKARVGVAAMT